MRMRIGYLLLAVMIAMVTVPAYAATYDATGRWLIETDPDQTISISGVSIDVPDAWLWATITQVGGGDRFDMETDEIADLGNVSYLGSGNVVGSNYIFDDVIIDDLDLGTIPGLEILSGVEIGVSFANFVLTSENELSGIFNIEGLGDVTFTGERAAVPLPAGIWLLGSGMVALFRIRRRSRT